MSGREKKNQPPLIRVEPHGGCSTLHLAPREEDLGRGNQRKEAVPRKEESTKPKKYLVRDSRTAK